MNNYTELIKTFAIRNIELIPVKDSKSACEKVLELIKETSTVGYGGSETLKQIGILDKLRKGKYILFDRSKVVPFTRESNNLVHMSQHADYFLSSSNAVTTDGKIVNKDRTGNRVSALIYGPEKVIIVIGKNKLVKTLDEAFDRIKTIAAPMNAKRKECKTPCAITGKCSDCMSPDRLCCNTVIIERQHNKGRMTIILVEENLGF